tara:strand:- start:1739 stop:2335 length:597 start_codon:yes stop_codon:yes gene_type:complete
MNSCNYHQFDDGQGLNGNIGPSTDALQQGNDNHQHVLPTPAVLPDGYSIDPETKNILNANGDVVGNSVDSGGNVNIDFDGGYDPRGFGDRTRQNNTSLGKKLYNPDLPGVALCSKQIALIRQTDPNFKLGDKVGLMYNGQYQEAVFFDRGDDAQHQRNNYYGHMEINPQAATNFGIKFKSNSVTNNGTMHIIALRKNR